MNKHIVDPDVQLLADIAGTINSDFPPNDEWEGSPFAWILEQPPATKGKIGEMLIAEWLKNQGLVVVRSADTEADRIVNDHRIEIKFSRKWKATNMGRTPGIYKFQQLRDQRYDFAVCLGICPFDAHCWAIPKSEILRRWKENDGITPQHGGKAGVDTAWLSFRVDSPPEWLAEWGGSLQSAFRVIQRLVGNS